MPLTANESSSRQELDLIFLKVKHSMMNHAQMKREKKVSVGVNCPSVISTLEQMNDEPQAVTVISAPRWPRSMEGFFELTLLDIVDDMVY